MVNAKIPLVVKVIAQNKPKKTSIAGVNSSDQPWRTARSTGCCGGGVPLPGAARSKMSLLSAITARVTSPAPPATSRAVRQPQKAAIPPIARGATLPPKNPENVCRPKARPTRFSEIAPDMIA